MNKFIVSEAQIVEAVRNGLMFSIRDGRVLSILINDIKDELHELLHKNCKAVQDESERNVVTETNISYGFEEDEEMEELKYEMFDGRCELCGADDTRWKIFGHWFCEECTDNLKNDVLTTLNKAKQERKARKRLEIIDVCEFSKIKEGKIDLVRTSKEYPVGEVIDICYNGSAYKDSVKCKVTGCYKSTWAGYIIEFFMQQ